MNVHQKTFDEMDDDAVCQRRSFKHKLDHCDRTFERWVVDGKFPPPLIKNPVRYWRVGDVRAFLNGTWYGKRTRKAA